MKLKTGQFVRHAKYGWGTILDNSREQTEVYFQSVGVKKFTASATNFDFVQEKFPKKKHTS